MAKKILYFTSHCPVGPTYGAQLRALNIALLLEETADVSVVLIPLKSLEEEQVLKTKELVNLKGVYPLVKQEKSFVDYFRHELDPYFTNTHGLQIAPQHREELMSYIDEYDYLWFHSVRIPNCLGLRKHEKAVLDIDDIPSQFYLSALAETPSLGEKLKFWRKALLWNRREKVLLRRFASVVVCSDKDKVTLGGAGNVHVVPNGFTLEEENVEAVPADPPRIGFIGTLEYRPNKHGIQWFIDHVWLNVLKNQPHARLRIVGKGSEQFDCEQNGIDGLGFVESAAKEIASWSLMIVPIHIGGGTRIKIAESFARKCPVVSTHLGAFGYDVVDGRELLFADEPEEFAEACISILDDRSLGVRLADAGFSQFENGLSWQSLKPRLEAVVKDTENTQ